MVRPRTPSSVVNLCSAMAARIRPFDTPLQPQISAVSGRVSGPAVSAPPASAGPKTSVSRRVETSAPSRIMSRYQAASRASPYSTAPISRSSRSTSRLWTPRAASRKTISSVVSSPVKSPAEDMSMPVTFSRVPVTEGV